MASGLFWGLASYDRPLGQVCVTWHYPTSHFAQAEESVKLHTLGRTTKEAPLAAGPTKATASRMVLAKGLVGTQLLLLLEHAILSAVPHRAASALVGDHLLKTLREDTHSSSTLDKNGNGRPRNECWPQDESRRICGGQFL